MKLRFFIIFALAMIAQNAFAADDLITGGAGTCNADVLGVTDGAVQTVAEWSPIEYDCPAGQYLLIDGDNIACAPCAKDSYCPGGIYTVESENSGTYFCPMDYPETLTTGATKQEDCVGTCTAQCVQPACPDKNAICTFANYSEESVGFYGGECLTAECAATGAQCKDGYSGSVASLGEFFEGASLNSQIADGSFFFCPRGNFKWDELNSVLNGCSFLAPGEIMLVDQNSGSAVVFESVINNISPDMLSTSSQRLDVCEHGCDYSNYFGTVFDYVYTDRSYILPDQYSKLTVQNIKNGMYSWVRPKRVATQTSIRNMLLMNGIYEIAELLQQMGRDDALRLLKMYGFTDAEIEKIYGYVLSGKMPSAKDIWQLIQFDGVLTAPWLESDLPVFLTEVGQEWVKSHFPNASDVDMNLFWVLASEGLIIQEASPILTDIFSSAVVGSCAGNEMLLEWEGVTPSETDIASMMAHVCIYGNGLIAPEGPGILGKVFKGWRTPTGTIIQPETRFVENGCVADFLGTTSGKAVFEAIYEDDPNMCYASCVKPDTCPGNAISCEWQDFQEVGIKQNGVCSAVPSTCPLKSIECGTGSEQVDYGVFNPMFISSFVGIWPELDEGAQGQKFPTVACPLSGDSASEFDAVDCQVLNPGEVRILTPDGIDSNVTDAENIAGIVLEFSANGYDATTPGVVASTWLNTINPPFTAHTSTGSNLWGRMQMLIPSRDSTMFDMVIAELDTNGAVSDATMQYLQQDMSGARLAKLQTLISDKAAGRFATDADYEAAKTVARLIMLDKTPLKMSADQTTAVLMGLLTGNMDAAMAAREKMSVHNQFIFDQLVPLVQKYTNNPSDEALQRQLLDLIAQFVDEVSSPWMYLGTKNGDLYTDAGKLMMASVRFSREVYPTTLYCNVNSINIEWMDGDALHHSNMCVYDGSIPMPAEPVKPGYTFKGWKLVEQ